VFVQNFIMLSAAVRQLSCSQRKSKQKFGDDAGNILLSLLPRTVINVYYKIVAKQVAELAKL